jgi:hypothetical protein
MKWNIYKAILGVLISLILAFTIIACSPKSTPQVQKTLDPRTYITPNDPDVQNILPQIIASKAFWRTDFGAIQVWVDKNVTYTPDKDDYWQKANETLKRRKGDCEDYAILLCTLLRAYEVPAKDVYVAIGRNSEGKGHAYLIEDWYKGKWRVIEPQDGGLFTTDAQSCGISVHSGKAGYITMFFLTALNFEPANLGYYISFRDKAKACRCILLTSSLRQSKGSVPYKLLGSKCSETLIRL